jgi:hypothetical protein
LAGLLPAPLEQHAVSTLALSVEDLLVLDRGGVGRGQLALAHGAAPYQIIFSGTPAWPPGTSRSPKTANSLDFRLPARDLGYSTITSM